MKVVHVGLPNLVAVQMESPQLLGIKVKVVKKIHARMMMEDMDVVTTKIVTVQSQGINVVQMESNQQKVQTFKDVISFQEMFAVFPKMEAKV